MIDPDWVTEGSKTRKNIIVIGRARKKDSPLMLVRSRFGRRKIDGQEKKGEANDLKRTCGRQERGKIIQNKQEKKEK